VWTKLEWNGEYTCNYRAHIALSSLRYHSFLVTYVGSFFCFVDCFVFFGAFSLVCFEFRSVVGPRISDIVSVA